MYYFLCNNEHLSYSDKLYRVLGLLQTRAILSHSQSSLLHSARATDISWGRARNSTRILSLLVSFSRSNSDSLLTFAERRTEKLPKGCERQQKVLSKSAVQKCFSYNDQKMQHNQYLWVYLQTVCVNSIKSNDHILWQHVQHSAELWQILNCNKVSQKSITSRSFLKVLVQS